MRIFQSSQKPVSRLKPPTITRSSTLTSSINKIDSPKSVQLPDIVPNATSQPVTLNESIVNEVLHSVEPVNIETPHVIDVPALPVDDGTHLFLAIPRCNSSSSSNSRDDRSRFYG